jgi:CheY-like chemotaxis protein
MALLISLIDADVNLNSQLAAELSRRGFRVEPASDSSDVMNKKDDLPQLIVLCIDPKRTGWAVCNRLRKSPTLRTVPLIITSAEATEKDFDDHKKLKTRAEEYLHKPFSAATLVEKIHHLVGSPEGGGEADLELAIEEVAVESSGLLMLEDLEPPSRRAATPVELGGFGEEGDDEHTRVGTFHNQIDGEVDLETHAAFASIGVDDLSEAPLFSSAPSPAVNKAPVFAPPAGHDDDPFNVPTGETVAPLYMEAAPAATTAALDELDLGLEDVAAQAAVIPTPSKAQKVETGAKGRGPSDEDSLALQRENEQLRREVEELRNRPQVKSETAAASGFSREREFLNLREVINKKEKEVLDLRDSLDSKERQILDGKDRLRELERKYRDLDEKVLGTERELVSAREKIEALTVDKETVVEREKQVKSRLEDSQRALQRSEEEVESWKTQNTAAAVAHHDAVRELEEAHATTLSAAQARHAAELESTLNQEAAARAELAAQAQAAQSRLESNYEQQMAELRESLTNEKEGLRLRFEQQIAELKGQHQAEAEAAAEQNAATVVQLQEEHGAALALAEQTHADQLAGIRARAAAELKAAERKHAEAEEAFRQEHTLQLQAAEDKRAEELARKTEEHRLEIEQLVRDHAAERAGLERDHETAVQTLDERRQNELRELSAQGLREQEATLGAIQAKHDEELRVQRDSHQRKLHALEESHEDLKAGMQARHTAQFDELTTRHGEEIAAFQAAVAERDVALGEFEKRVAELEAALGSEQQQNLTLSQQFGETEERLQAAQNGLAERNQQLNERAQRISELEAESAGYQDQILKAYQRIKSDENIVSRAKKALAIALTLLDENTPEGSEEAMS